MTGALIERYLLYARGGAGIVVSGAVSVKEQKSGPLLRLNDDSFTPGLKQLTELVHGESDAKTALNPFTFFKIARNGYRQKVENLSLNDVKEIAELFACAALRARSAGFNAVELHFAHVYTILSRYNQRKDEYCGSLENRLRLAKEVINAVRQAVGEEHVLGVRINGDEFTLGGNTLAQSRVIALRLAESGLDYISISAGGKFEDAIPRHGEALDSYTGYSGSRTMPPNWMPGKVIFAVLFYRLRKEFDRN